MHSPFDAHEAGQASALHSFSEEQAALADLLTVRTGRSLKAALAHALPRSRITHAMAAAVDTPVT